MKLLKTVCLIALLSPGLVFAQARGDKTLTVGVQDLRDTLDPAVNLANAGFPLSNNLFDTLIRRDYASNAEGTGATFAPGLAESWKQLDELTLDLSLRAGVVFHNGEALSSRDVVFTFERILDPVSKYASARSQLGNIARVEALDERTVRIVTKRPDPVLIKMLAYPGAAIVPKRYFQEVGFDAFQSRPVGSGPYKLVSFKADDRVALQAFDKYWGGTPPAARLTFRLIPEISARITALANGEVDLINSVPPDQLAAVERLGCFTQRAGQQPRPELSHRAPGDARQAAAPGAQPRHRPRPSDQVAVALSGTGVERPSIRRMGRPLRSTASQVRLRSRSGPQADRRPSAVVDAGLPRRQPFRQGPGRAVRAVRRPDPGPRRQAAADADRAEGRGCARRPRSRPGHDQLGRPSRLLAEAAGPDPHRDRHHRRGPARPRLRHRCIPLGIGACRHAGRATARGARAGLSPWRLRHRRRQRSWPRTDRYRDPSRCGDPRSRLGVRRRIAACRGRERSSSRHRRRTAGRFRRGPASQRPRAACLPLARNRLLRATAP